jgi:8-oxo-dGTP pyrophosphatase MutT (NUDIX family)
MSAEPSFPGAAEPLERRIRTALAGSQAAESQDSWRPFGAHIDRLAAAFPDFSFDTLRESSVLVPILRRADGPSVLLTRRADTLRTHQGQMSFPGGRREPGETPVETALREAQEEVGLSPAVVDVIGRLHDTPTMTGFIISPIVGVVEREPSLRVDAREVAELVEVPLAFVLDRRNYRRESFVRGGTELWYYELLWQEQRVWGATAGILHDLCERVAAT